MSRSIVFGGLLVLLTVTASIQTKEDDPEPVAFFDLNPAKQDAFSWKGIFGVSDASDIRDAYEVADLFSSSQLTALPNVQYEGIIRYTIGKRVANDRVVSHGEDYGKWKAPVNVTLTLKYPSNGQGAKVTFAEFFVKRKSNIGQPQVIAGGIGQSTITIILNANNTLQFAYKGDIYGI